MAANVIGWEFSHKGERYYITVKNRYAINALWRADELEPIFPTGWKEMSNFHIVESDTIELRLNRRLPSNWRDLIEIADKQGFAELADDC